MEKLQQAINSAFLSILTASIMLGSVYITNYINAKIKLIQNETNAKYLEQLNNTVKQVVNAVSQTIVDDLKSSGTFDMLAQQSTLELALDKVKEIAEKQALNLVQELHGDIDTYLKVQIENQIKLSKGI